MQILGLSLAVPARSICPVRRSHVSSRHAAHRVQSSNTPSSVPSFREAEDLLANRAIEQWRKLHGKRILIGIADCKEKAVLEAVLASLLPQRGGPLVATGPDQECSAIADLSAATSRCPWLRINATPGEDVATLLPMDGFHLYRAQLDAMADPELAHARRGAPYTFDASAFLKCVASVYAAQEAERIVAPSFDHVLGDPCAEGFVIERRHKIILVEGLYVLLDEHPWCKLRDYCADSWFLDVDLDTAMAAVYKRQLLMGRRSKEQIQRRIAENDRPNAELARASRGRAKLVLNMDAAHKAARAHAEIKSVQGLLLDAIRDE